MGVREGLRSFSWGLGAFFISISVSAAVQDSAGNWTGPKRLRAVERLCDDLRENYGFWNLKKARAGNDPEKLCQDLKQSEQVLTDPSSALAGVWARHNLEFRERLNVFLAKFQDGHLEIRHRDLGHFVLPFDVRPAVLLDGKPGLIVTVVAEAILKDELDVGDQLLEVDGVPIEKVISDLALQESASTLAGARHVVSRKVTDRLLPYPRKAEVVLKFRRIAKGDFEVRTRWMTPGGTLNRDQAVLARELGIQDLPEKPSWQGFGDPLRARLAAPVGDEIQEFLSPVDGQPILRGGLLALKGAPQVKAFYLAVYSFNVSELVYKQPSGSMAKVSMGGALASLVRRFRAQPDFAKIPLILDLRENEGGEPKLASQLLAFLADPKKPFRNQVRGVALGASGFSLAIESPVLGQESARLLRESYLKSQAQGLHTTLAVRGEPIRVAKDDQDRPLNLPGPVLALVSPGCVSACEGAIQVLEANGRAWIAGTPTHGTGGGSRSGVTLEPHFRVSPVMSMNVPNNLFGPPVGEEEKPQILEQEIAELSSENRPSVPKFKLERSLIDWLTADEMILKKASEIAPFAPRLPGDASADPAPTLPSRLKPILPGRRTPVGPDPVQPALPRKH